MHARRHCSSGLRLRACVTGWSTSKTVLDAAAGGLDARMS